MHNIRHYFILFSAVAVFISCSSSQQTTTTQQTAENSVITDSVQTSGDNHLKPYPIDILPTYNQAIIQNTRTPNGEPGPEYWQQYATYQLHAEIIPEDTLLQGNGTITYFNNSPDSLQAIYMELSQNLHDAGVVRNEVSEVTGGVNIHNITLGGDTLLYNVRQGPRYFIDGTRLVLVNGEKLLPDDSTKITVEWSFKIPQQGASGRMGYNEDNLFHIAYWYPFVSVYDDVNGWFTDSFLGQTEFYMGYADYDVQITIPREWLITSTGTHTNRDTILKPVVLDRLEKAEKSDEPVAVVTEDDFGAVTKQSNTGKHTWHYTAKNIRDFVFSATTESKWDAMRTPVGDLDGDGQTDYTRIDAIYRTSAPLWSEVADYSAHAITFLSDYTGVSYPWPHMSAIEGGGITGGGMEYPMMTLMGDYNSRGATALYNVTAHELAHMWVPMIVGTNERRYSWMDEGTTTFNEAEARADRFPDTRPIIGDQNNYLRIVGTGLEGEIMRWSNYHYLGAAYGIASYPKPAAVLEALKGVLGEDIFKKALQGFMDRWKYKHPYPWDLFKTFEDYSGRDLNWFWRSWYYESWPFDQKIVEVTQEAGDNLVTIKISDNGRTPMPVLLTFTLEDGKEIKKRIPVSYWLEGADTITRIYDMPGKVKTVEIDKERYFPDANRANNTQEL